MQIIMDRFKKVEKNYFGKLVKKSLLTGCLGLVGISSGFCAVDLCANGSEFACNLPNAVPFKVSYRQVNFPSDYKVVMTYVPPLDSASWPSSVSGQWDPLSCIYQSMYGSDEVKYHQGALSTDMGVYPNSFSCVKGLVANIGTTSNPLNIKSDGYPVENNLQNPDYNGINEYLFRYATYLQYTYLTGDKTDVKNMNLFYINALFYNSDQGYIPVRWVPGRKGSKYTQKVSQGGKAAGNLGYFQVTIQGKGSNIDVGRVLLTGDGNIYYLGGFDGELSLDDFSVSTENKSMHNVELMASVTPGSSDTSLDINVMLACVNPTAEQMDPCGAPGASDSECAILCDAKNLPTA